MLNVPTTAVLCFAENLLNAFLVLFPRTFLAL